MDSPNDQAVFVFHPLVTVRRNPERKARSGNVTPGQRSQNQVPDGLGIRRIDVVTKAFGVNRKLQRPATSSPQHKVGVVVEQCSNIVVEHVIEGARGDLFFEHAQDHFAALIEDCTMPDDAGRLSFLGFFGTHLTQKGALLDFAHEVDSSSSLGVSD